MALAYVKEDVTRYLLARRFEGLGVPGEAHVIFPLRGRQPLPFELPPNLDLTLEGTLTYPDEFRWWIWPLVYADEIPLPSGILDIVRSSPFHINSYSGGSQNTIPEKLPKDLQGNPSPLQTAELEFVALRARIYAIVVDYKDTYPEIFGESIEGTSSLDSEEPPPKLSRVAKIATKISPKLGRKVSLRRIRYR